MICSKCPRNKTCDTPCDAYIYRFSKRWRDMQQTFGVAPATIAIEHTGGYALRAAYEIRECGKAVFRGSLGACATFLGVSRITCQKYINRGYTGKYDVIRLTKVYTLYLPQTGEKVCCGDADEVQAALGIGKSAFDNLMWSGRRGKGKYNVEESWEDRT